MLTRQNSSSTTSSSICAAIVNGAACRSVAPNSLRPFCLYHIVSLLMAPWLCILPCLWQYTVPQLVAAYILQAGHPNGRCPSLRTTALEARSFFSHLELLGRQDHICSLQQSETPSHVLPLERQDYHPSMRIPSRSLFFIH